jgi:hypothetical protein
VKQTIYQNLDIDKNIENTINIPEKIQSNTKVPKHRTFSASLSRSKFKVNDLHVPQRRQTAGPYSPITRRVARIRVVKQLCFLQISKTSASPTSPIHAMP